MLQTAISVSGVSKRFRRGGHAELCRDRFRRLLRRQPSSDSNVFWSLRNISFNVAPGEAFGVIGPNGAGKSTLLKLLAGILRPDEGIIELSRPLSALIELGAGFHGDLSGRENIFLNASILGMSRRDVLSRFDRIVDFAGIGEALDTPVKWYSSGMYARLGFAVAAHVNPRVLLIDEVLSVGDRAFRAKCMAKMSDFLREGIAVVFVSHDVASVQRFCHRALVLRAGEIDFIGPATEAVWRYHDACIEPANVKTDINDAPVRVSNLQATDPHGRPTTRWRPGDALRLQFEVDYHMDMHEPSYGLSLMRLDDHMSMFESSSSRMGVESPSARRGDRHEVIYDLRLNVPPGQYAIGIHLRERNGVEYALQNLTALRFNVIGPTIANALVHLDPCIRVQRTTPSIESTLPQTEPAFAAT